MNLQAGVAAAAAGAAALGSSLIWILWLASGGTLTGWALALGPLLLAPAAIVWMLRLEIEAGGLIALATGAGVLGLILQAGTSLAFLFTPRIESICLALAAIWWLGLGTSLLNARRSLAMATLGLGLVALLDAALVLVETRTSAVPFWLRPAGPLRPLYAAAWSVAVGIDLLRLPWTAPPPDTLTERLGARWERFSGRKR